MVKCSEVRLSFNSNYKLAWREEEFLLKNLLKFVFSLQRSFLFQLGSTLWRKTIYRECGPWRRTFGKVFPTRSEVIKCITDGRWPSNELRHLPGTWTAFWRVYGQQARKGIKIKAAIPKRNYPGRNHALLHFRVYQRVLGKQSSNDQCSSQVSSEWNKLS